MLIQLDYGKPSFRTDSYAKFTSSLANFHRLQQSIRINAANLEEVIVGHDLPRSGFFAICLARVTKAVRQMEADERFYRATTDEAEVTLRAVQSRAQLERASAEWQANELSEQRNGLITIVGLILAILATIVGLSNLFTDETGKAIARDPSSYLQVFMARVFLIIVASMICGSLFYLLYRFLKKMTPAGRDLTKDVHGPVTNPGTAAGSAPLNNSGS